MGDLVSMSFDCDLGRFLRLLFDSERNCRLKPISCEGFPRFAEVVDDFSWLI